MAEEQTEQENLDNLEIDNDSAQEQSNQAEQSDSNEETPETPETPDEDQNSDEQSSEPIKEPSPAQEEEDDKIYSLQKKSGKYEKILKIAAIVVAVSVLLILVLYFTGVFDSEPETLDSNTTKDANITKDMSAEKKPAAKKRKKYKFNQKDINEKRLNKKLWFLTKYEIIESEEKEIEKLKELERKRKESMPKKRLTMEDVRAIEEKMRQQELEKIKKLEDNGTSADSNTTQNSVISNENNSSDANTTTEQKNDQNQTLQTDQPPEQQDTNKSIKSTSKKEENTFLNFIQVATLKYKLYNSFLKELKELDAKISVCKDEEERTQIFIGPFNDIYKRKLIIEKINSNIVSDAFAVELTKEEFDNRCSF